MDMSKRGLVIQKFRKRIMKFPLANRWFQSIPKPPEGTYTLRDVMAWETYFTALGELPELPRSMKLKNIDSQYPNGSQLIRAMRNMTRELEEPSDFTVGPITKYYLEDWFIDQESFVVSPEEFRLGIIRELRRFIAGASGQTDLSFINRVIEFNGAVFFTLLQVSDVFSSSKEADNGNEKAAGDRVNN